MRRRRILAFFPALALAGLFTGTSASAACTFSNTVAVSFPVYDVFSATDDDGTGAFTIGCTTNTSAMVSLSAGGGGSFSPRSMAGPRAVLLNYNLYSDGGRTTVWGDGTGGSTSVSRSLSAGVPFTFTIFARIFHNQSSVIAGLYSDSVIVTVAP